MNPGTIPLLLIALITGCSSLPDVAPKSSSELLDEADRYYLDKDYASASEYYQALIERHPEASYAHFRLGNIAFQSGDLEAASLAFQSAIDAYPGDARYHYNLALVRLNQAQVLASNAYQKFTARGEPAEEFERLANDISRLLED